MTWLPYSPDTIYVLEVPTREWRRRHKGRWWLPGRDGYTDDLDEAGRYTANEAAMLVNGSGRIGGCLAVRALPDARQMTDAELHEQHMAAWEAVLAIGSPYDLDEINQAFEWHDYLRDEQTRRKGAA
jgi:hypothetical protein